jgi:50S ribosomal protein L16 3-hydroxylase
MRRLADARRLAPAEAAGLSEEARELVAQWAEAGWLHEVEGA